ncbi:unnamed protein product, partial [Didymodactylos carnosus]
MKLRIKLTKLKMIITNANTVNVPLIQTSCMKTEFDSTYPSSLNGIITSQDFYKSITHINRVLLPPTLFRAALYFIPLWMIVGFLLFAITGVRAAVKHESGFPTIVVVGFVMWGTGIVLTGFGCVLIQSQRLQQLRKAVACESAKYSSSEKPCTWRLDTIPGWRTRHLSYTLKIDIESNVIPTYVVYQNVYPLSNYSDTPPAYQQYDQYGTDAAQSVLYYNNSKPQNKQEVEQQQTVTYCSQCDVAQVKEGQNESTSSSPSLISRLVLPLHNKRWKRRNKKYGKIDNFSVDLHYKNALSSYKLQLSKINGNRKLEADLNSFIACTIAVLGEYDDAIGWFIKYLRLTTEMQNK